MKTQSPPTNTTLKDIAAHTGVSITAVSHVLNNRLGRVRVSDDTKKRIKQAARELNYVPQLKARSMATKKSYAIAALYSTTPVVGDIGNAAYFIHALCGVEEVCKSVNYHCMFATCDLQSPEKFVKPRLMQDGSVDGVILVGYTSTEVARELSSLGLPCVHMGSNLDPSIDMQHIDPDMNGSFELAVERLYALGHRKIELYLPQGPGPKAIADRFAKLCHQYPDLQTPVVFGPKRSSHVSDIHEHARELAQDSSRPTAYICHSPHATGLLEVFNAAGLQSPRDFSLIANGSGELTERGIGPGGIKTAMIELPSRLTAQYATVCLLEKLSVRSDEYPKWEAKVPCNLVEGPTIGPAPSL